MSFKQGQAPKVTNEQVNLAIKKTEYTLLPDGRTTVCTLTLDNGFTVRGESSCVFIENFDPEIGALMALRKATDKVWAFLGFRLAEKYHQQRLRKSRGARYRDSVSGLYVTREYASAYPDTTEREL